MKTERLQVLIDSAQRARLEATAAARNVSVAHLVRTAIDVAYPPEASRRTAAAAAVLGAAPMPVPEPDSLREELEALRGRL